VREGDTRIEARTAVFDGGALDGDWAHRAQVSHGFTSWWQATLIARASQPDGESAELRSIGLENRVDFIATRDWPVHFGAQAEYKFGVDDAEDEVEFKLLAERERGAFGARLNLIAERPVDDDDWTYEYAARVSWRASDVISFGAEAFGEPEADAHYVGPRGAFELGDVTLSLGYLAGLADAQADGQFRLSFELAP
jgi:hypothetical protein